MSDEELRRLERAAADGDTAARALWLNRLRSVDPGRFRALEDELVTAIRAAPLDDGPRLAYADWLVDGGEGRAELIRVQCALAARAARRTRRRPKGAPTMKELRAREAKALARLAAARPDWAAEWPPYTDRGFATGVTVRDVATFLARHDAIRRDHPLAVISVADGSHVVVSPDGRRYAVLRTESESWGSIASSTREETTTLTVYDRESGQELHSESSSRSEWESSSGHTTEGGVAISWVTFSADGRTLTVRMSDGATVTRSL